jgi:integrase
MRPGEILALQVGDVDGSSVWVRRRLYRGQIDTPKTKRSYRQVALSLGTLNLLAEWLQAIGTSDHEGWIFSTENNTPIWRDNVWLRNMRPKLKAIGLDWATFQVMRRTFATLSKQAGVDAHTRSAQMGNTVNVNENEYAISTFEERLAAVRRLETNLGQ